MVMFVVTESGRFNLQKIIYGLSFDHLAPPKKKKAPGGGGLRFEPKR